jgi:CheY-like chemotaxis protein
MKNILLVDDERAMLRSLADGLSCYAEDWNILTAENGKQGAEILDSHLVDIVVTDLRMPAMDGYELLLYVRKKHPDLPVIVMTADSFPDLEQQLLPLGPAQCVRKPFELSEMAENISSKLA